MIIEAHDVGVTIDHRQIIHGESVLCAPGEMTALIGPSGSGKTTLLHRDRRAFWRDHAAFVLQDYGIIDDEPVSFNVTMRRTRGFEKKLQAALEHVGLAGRDTELASHLSGGEKQRLALARAVYRDARILFVDEPTASLDAINRQLVVGLFAGFARRGATVIVSTHDDEMIAACAHQHRMNVPAAAAPTY